jgi:tripeptidyl-peptidase-1
MLNTLVFALLAASANAELVQMEPSVKTFASSRWLKERRADAKDEVKAMFVLKHDKASVQALEKKLLDVASPKSANYGKWMTREEVIAATSPKQENVDKVMSYLQSFGVNATKVNRYNDIIEVTMNAPTAEKVLSTEFAKFRSITERNAAILRVTKPYFLPEEVASVVSIVDDIMRFPSASTPIRSFGAEDSADAEFAACGSGCNGYTTPAVLQARYGYTDVTSVSAGNSMSVAEFQYQYYDQKDLDIFSDACDVTVTVEEAVGGNNEKLCERGGCVESLLDIEYIGAISHPIPLTVVYSSTYSLFDWVNSVMDMDSPPLVNSVSYGNDEIQQTSSEYMEECNTQFMKAGAMGITILFASGDQGVWGRTGASKNGVYNPDFPGGSPYITAVGGTNFAEKSVIGEESTWDCGGGGFSNEFPTPEWQQDVVNEYFATATAAGVLPEANLFNAGGRGYPDLAALGGQTNPYCISTSGGHFGGVAGTSASCPVVAGMFANINNERLAAGKSPLGWINPFIYANPQCFNDVNDGSMNNCYKGYSGFAALNGWDPATGMGTPIYSCLSEAAAALP